MCVRGRNSNSPQPHSEAELSHLPEDYTAQMSALKESENTHEAATLDIYCWLRLVCLLHGSLNHLTFQLLGFLKGVQLFISKFLNAMIDKCEPLKWLMVHSKSLLLFVYWAFEPVGAA